MDSSLISFFAGGITGITIYGLTSYYARINREEWQKLVEDERELTALRLAQLIKKNANQVVSQKDSV